MAITYANDLKRRRAEEIAELLTRPAKTPEEEETKKIFSKRTDGSVRAIYELMGGLVIEGAGGKEAPKPARAVDEDDDERPKRGRPRR